MLEKSNICKRKRWMVKFASKIHVGEARFILIFDPRWVVGRQDQLSNNNVVGPNCSWEEMTTCNKNVF